MFSYLLDIRQDQLIDNAIAYFKDVYVEKVVNSNVKPAEMNWDGEFVELLPET